MHAKTRVLVLDDDRLLRLSLRHALAGEGWTVDLASRVRDAIDLLSRLEYDLLLLDMNLPDGSGVEVLRWARDLAPDANVLILTGSVDDAALAEVDAAGVAGVLRKPCRLAEVVRAAHDALGDGEGNDGDDDLPPTATSGDGIRPSARPGDV